ncbi:inositol hexakisphosphate kinase, putative [Perkinsus marinus ATCC 50983]|uniref:Kinase n=1 Tax=Perkinsus marinus (strain ATCC 50983 / TXsc) TaxID=423536 RepID=C5LVX3_PERM5|nr:inositol hexakisphosphate kinase, putative [Perkinsus marinus ATCC 50983]EEQ99124.1 inositol hexakisphosphate kinase, putative [Perkinsus marinus ATCC 50983]|eukprot:XP_002766407.1 inositol hexakisphosphate kinase, putative [Perkinsus marinus ATCC 50983]
MSNRPIPPLGATQPKVSIEAQKGAEEERMIRRYKEEDDDDDDDGDDGQHRLHEQIDREREKARRKREEAAAAAAVVLEDLAHGMATPCILDLKMGAKQRAVRYGLSKAKMESKLKKSRQTTSHSLAFRMCGVQLYDRISGERVYYNKYYGRKQSEQGVFQTINTFFDSIQEPYKKILIKRLVDKLERLLTILQSLNGFRFWSGSLLFVFDGPSTTLEQVGKMTTTTTTFKVVPEVEADTYDNTKHSFWKDYVAQRKPCVIRGGSKDYIKRMSNDNMIRVAGEDMVTAEERKDMSEGFGKTDWNDDKRLHIPFKDFINKVTTGKVYMTTQDIPLSEYDGGPIKRMGTHIQKLIDNKLIPKNPSILEDTGLTQYQVNMWFGDAKDGRMEPEWRMWDNGEEEEEEEEEEEAQLDKLLDIAIAEGNFDDDDEEEEEEEGPEGKKRKVVMEEEEELKNQGPSHFCNTTIITIDDTGDIMLYHTPLHKEKKKKKKKEVDILQLTIGIIPQCMEVLMINHMLIITGLRDGILSYQLKPPYH